MAIVNVVDIKKRLEEKPDNIVKLLDAMGCHKIREYENEIRCASPLGVNPTEICVKKDSNISAIYRTSAESVKGDIIVLIKHFKKCTFIGSMKFMCACLGIPFDGYDSQDESEDILPFGGYFMNLSPQKNNTVALTYYDENILSQFEDIPSYRFFKDGIDLQTQLDFKIMYDIFSERIVVPWRSPEGQIVGLMGRYNNTTEYCDKNNISKWKPIYGYNFPKSHLLFGYYENYNAIQKNRTIFLGESEKFPMQLRSMIVRKVTEDGEITYERLSNGLGLGSHDISEKQGYLIGSLFAENIILAYDEDISEKILIDEANKLKNIIPYNCNIGYILDRCNKYLPKGSKASPSDFGADVFKKLCIECVTWI